MTTNLEIWRARRNVFEDQKAKQFQIGYHWCSLCHQFKELKEFSKNKSAKFGYHHWCKTCHSKQRKGDARTKRKARLYNRQLKSYYKSLLGGKCAKCGYKRTQVSLEFHHIDPGEKDSIVTKLISTNKHNDIMFELDKCILLCRNCHMELESYCWGCEFIKNDELGWKIKPNTIIEYQEEFWTNPSDKILYSQQGFNV